MIFPASIPELSTERLTLRSMSEADLVLFEEIVNVLPDRPPRDARQVWEKTNADFEAGTGLTWAIDLNGEFIGTIGFYRGFENEVGEVGYVLRSEYRGNGYMSEAMSSVLLFGFKNMKLSGISAFTKDENEASCLLLKRFGFREQEEHWEDYRRHDLAAGEFKLSH